MMQDSWSGVIESPRFAARLGVVSTPAAFEAAALKVGTISNLVTALSSGSSPEPVVARLDRLLRLETDQRYCHPKDLAIGIYFLVLGRSVPRAAIAPARLAFELPNLWWGRVMAMRFAASESSTDSGFTTLSDVSPHHAQPRAKLRTISSDITLLGETPVFIEAKIETRANPGRSSLALTMNKVHPLFDTRNSAKNELLETA
jgi:hypothetical protein